MAMVWGQCSITETHTDVRCRGQLTGSIDITVGNGTVPYTYAWTGPNSYYSTNEDISGLEAGSYTVNVSGSDDSCTGNMTINIDQPDPLVSGVHNIASLIVCENFDPAILSLNPMPSGGTPPYSYQWYENSNAVGTGQSSFDPDNLTSVGSYEYYCIVTDDCNQTAETIHKLITVEADPTITISGGGNVCQGVNRLLTTGIQGGAGTYTYIWESSLMGVAPWNNIGETGSSYSPITSTPGTNYYRVTLVSNGAACNNSRDIEALTVNALPDPPTGISPQAFCEKNIPTVSNLSATGTAIQWYDVSSGGSALTSTTALVNATYYASQTVAVCESDTRLAVTVTVADPAAPTGSANQSFCSIGTPTVADISVSGTGIIWYDAATSGSVVPIATVLVDGTTYYASQTIAGCESDTRLAVTVTVADPDAPTGSANQSFCSIGTPTVANISIFGTSIIWYDAATSGSVVPPATALVDGTTYYASQTIAGCESDTRLAVTVTVANPLPPIASSPQAFCAINNPTIASIAITATGTVTWYDAASAGNVLPTTTALLTGTTYYASQTIAGCESDSRLPVTTTLTPSNTINLSSAANTDAQTVCIYTPIIPITYTTTGATDAIVNNLPAGVMGSWVGNVVTISGTPTTSTGSPFNYTITLTGGCGTITATGSITINPDNTIILTSAPTTTSQTVCINTPITHITYATTGATGATVTGVPAGVSGTWAANVVTISGTPTVSGPFSYTVILTDGCGTVNATGTITVTADMTVGAASSTPTLCINTLLLSNITHTTTLATGIGTPTGLPAGVTAAWASNTITISGTPTEAGPFNYSIPLTGGCGTVNATGTITVTADMTVGAASSTPTLCINTALTDITHNTTRATGIGIPTGLPNGVTAAWAANTITISGTPTEPGTFNYSIPLTGGCSTVDATGAITVTPNNTITLTSGLGTEQQTRCINTAIADITYATTGATGATVTGLPTGVTGTWASNVVTISGTLTTSIGSPFYYTVTLTGGCGIIRTIGSITIYPLPSATISYSGSPYCATGTASVTILGHTGGTFTSDPGLAINQGSGTINLAASTTGEHTITYTFADNRCTNTTTTTIFINPLPTATIAYNGHPLCAAGTVNVILSGQTGGTFTSDPGLSIDVNTGAINLQASTTGTYHTITYTFSNGICSSSATTQIYIYPLPIATITYPGSPYCAVGSASVNLTGTSGGTFSSDPGLSINQGSGTINLATSTTGEHTITYTFADTRCTNTTTTTIFINPLPTATIAYNGHPLCAAGTVNVTLSGQTGGTFASDPGLSIDVNTGAINLQASTTGTYHTITYTFSNGTCSSSATTQIYIYPLPTATITYPGSPYCAVGSASVNLTGTSGGTFSSDPGLSINQVSGTINLAASTTGEHTITYTFADNRCTNTTTTTIFINPLPTATIAYNGHPLCAAGTVNVTLSGQTGGTFASDPGLSIDVNTGAINLQASTTGTYHTITYTFSNGTCSSSSTTQIYIYPLPTATISYPASPYCAVGSASVNLTGTSGGTFSSDPGLSINQGSGTINLAASTTGEHTITYTFADNRCTNTTTTTIFINPLPTATIAYNGHPLCAAGTVNVTLSGQTGGTFTSDPGLSIDVNTGAINLQASTTGTYHTITYTFSNGTCSSSSTTQIYIYPLPTATISYPASPYCAVGSASVNLTGTSGGTFSSDPGLSINQGSGTINLATSTPGEHTITLTFADNRCTNTTTTTIFINPLPTATIAYNGHPLCAAGTVNVTLSGQTGGTFASDPGLSIDVNTGEINLQASTTGISHTITYTFSNGTCSTHSTTTSVYIYPLPYCYYIIFRLHLTVPSGTASVTISGLTGGTFTSDPGLAINQGSGTVNLAASAPGEHTITYTFADTRCTNTTTTTIVITHLPTATISYPGTPFCTSVSTPQNVTLTGTGTYTGGTFTFVPAGLTIDATTGAITPSFSVSGTYTVTYTIPASGGCAAIQVTTSATITALPTASISYSGNPFCNNISSQQNVNLTGTGVYTGGTYSASPAGLVINSATGAITPSTSTPRTYTISYIIPAAGGCISVAATTPVTITALPTATISYAGTPFCTSLSAPQNVTISGTGAYTGGTYSASPAGLTLNSTTGAITPISSTPGTYTITYNIPASVGCTAIPVTTTVVITVLPTVSISYPGSPFCSSITDPQPVTMTGTGLYTGGTFSSTPAGLTINSSTGAITPGTSTPRIYTVTYTLPASGGCGIVIATTTLTITAVPTATICYSGTPFCSVPGTPQTVTISGTGTYSGGSYSFTPAGLTINSFTGTITPSLSTPGSYVVTYTIPATSGCAAIPVTTNVTVTASPTASINYPSSPFCKNWTAELVTLSGTGAYTDGTYSAVPAGLSINAGTGTINPNASTAGTYTVTYSTPASGGCASVTATTNVIVNPEFVPPVICCDQFFCAFNDPYTLTITNPTTGYGINVSYQWYRQTRYLFVWGAWTPIAGATLPTYSPPQVWEGAFYRNRYRLEVTNNGCSTQPNSYTSNTVEITVGSISITGTFVLGTTPEEPFCPDAAFTFRIQSESLAGLWKSKNCL